MPSSPCPNILLLFRATVLASPLPFYTSPCYNLVFWAITAMKLILLRSLISYFLIWWILQHSHLTLLTMPSLLKLTPLSSTFNSSGFFAIFSTVYMVVFLRVIALDPLALCCLGWQFVHFHGLPGTCTLMPPELYLQHLKFPFLPAPNLYTSWLLCILTFLLWKCSNIRKVEMVT